MRARAWLLGLGVLAIVAGGATVQAQGADRPVMVNEVRAWCAADQVQPRCGDVRFALRDDGSIHAVFNVGSDGILTESCVAGFVIPADVTGWAYVQDGDEERVIDLTELTAKLRVCELIVRR